MKPFIVFPFMLLLVLFSACSPSRIQITVPPATATVPSSPTLEPAVGPSSNGSPTAVATAPSAAQKQISGVTTDVLNIRSGPGLNYATKGQLKQGDSITITGKSSDGLWWQFSGGWVSATYVQVNGDTSAIPVATPSP